jgi:adenosylhomocysteine nucleosidase
MKHFGALYADPALLSMMACSATRVATHTELPAYLDPVRRDRQPQVFYYGIQGTSTIWSDNLEYTKKTMEVFHEIDEDGDWYSNLVSTLYGVPFIEVSVISNSILAFPQADRGTPAAPAGLPSSHVYAQRLSNQVTVDLIGHYGTQMLNGSYTTPEVSPYPEAAYAHPREAGTLLNGKDCH